MDVSLPGAKYRNPEDRIRFHEEVLDRLVDHAGSQDRRHGDERTDEAADDAGRLDRGAPASRARAISADDLRDGQRDLLRRDGNASSARTWHRRAKTTRERRISSWSMRHLFDGISPGEDPIGKRIGYGSPNDPHYWRTIVGIVADTREQLGEPPRSAAYAPFRQNLEPWNFASYLVKSSLPVEIVGEAGRRAVMAVGFRSTRVADTDGGQSDMRATIATQRFTTLIATMFAGIALILAVVGTFGVMSHGRSRTHARIRRSNGPRSDPTPNRHARAWAGRTSGDGCDDRRARRRRLARCIDPGAPV